MVVLRATQKVRKSLPAPVAESGAPDTALGDWYVNRIVVDRQPLLLLVSSLSRLAVLTPARDVKNLPARLGALIGARLERLGVDSQRVTAELEAMEPVVVGRTQNRSITGQMVDFANMIPFHLPVHGWDESTLRRVEDELGETPCLCGRGSTQAVWPAEEAARLLAERWAG